MMSDDEARVPSDVLDIWHEMYCTLCGVPFRLYGDRHLYDLGDERDPYWASYQDPHALDLGDLQDDLVWVSYFLARK